MSLEDWLLQFLCLFFLKFFVALNSHLNCPEGPPELRENYRFPARELTRIKAVLATHVTVLCHEWETLHGQP